MVSVADATPSRDAPPTGNVGSSANQKVMRPSSPAPAPESGGGRTPAERAAAGYRLSAYPAAMRAQSAGWPRTPTALSESPRRASHQEVFGQPLRSHSTRGGRPGMSTPRHLHSSVGDIIFGGDAWCGTSAPSTRGSAGGVGGARLHEVGNTKAPIGTPCRDGMSTQSPTVGSLLSHTFGAAPPERPTVGSRANLSRAHRHMNATAQTIIFAHPIS